VPRALGAELETIRHKVAAASYNVGGQDIARLFRQVDKDHSGTLDCDELLSMVRRVLRIGKSIVPDSDVKKLYDLLDADGDGDVELSELVEFLSASPVNDAAGPSPGKSKSQIIGKRRVELMHKAHAHALAKKEELRRSAQYEQDKRCTFQPVMSQRYQKRSERIVSRLHSSHDRSAREAQAQQALAVREAEELAGCSFAPEIHTRGRKHVVVAGVRSTETAYAKHKQRMERASSLRESKARDEADDSTVEDTTARYTASRRQKAKDASRPPPELFPRTRTAGRTSRGETNEKPVAFIDVDLSRGRRARIGLHLGEDPERVARRFCRTWSLSAHAEGALRSKLGELSATFRVAGEGEGGDGDADAVEWS